VKYVAIDPSQVSDPALRADLPDTWIDATNAGGSVGFTAPVSPDDYRDEIMLVTDLV
jgi:hypothetical protein